MCIYVSETRALLFEKEVTWWEVQIDIVILNNFWISLLRTTGSEHDEKFKFLEFPTPQQLECLVDLRCWAGCWVQAFIVTRSFMVGNTPSICILKVTLNTLREAPLPLEFCTFV